MGAGGGVGAPSRRRGGRAGLGRRPGSPSGDRASDADRVRIPTPLPILTPRLELRPCREGDGAAVAEAVAESVDALHPWFHPWMGPREAEADPVWQEVVACRNLAAFKARERVWFLVWRRGPGRLAGVVDLVKPDWRRRQFTLACWVRDAEHRQGLGSEGVGAVVTHSATWDVREADVSVSVMIISRLERPA